MKNVREEKVLSVAVTGVTPYHRATELRMSFSLADLGPRLRELEIIPDLVQTYA